MTGTMQFGDEAAVRRYEYDDSVVMVADFGAEHDATVDVVDDTVIVVADGEQYEYGVPDDDDARALIRNGVLTIEVEQ